MTGLKTALLIVLLMFTALYAVTIYEIQYTTNPGTNGTYPSDYAGQYVTTDGIVTATGYAGSYGYYISMPEGGAWKGILVFDSNNSPSVGHHVQVTGQVWEYYGLTEIRSVSNYQVLSVGNPIPPAEIITTAQATTEPYEGVLVQVQNAVVTQELNQYGEWAVSDGSGNVVVNDVFFNQSQLGSLITTGVLFDYIRGIGHYSYSVHSINPRSPSDVVVNTQGVVITLPTMQTDVGVQVTIPINVSNLTMSQAFQSYQFQLSYNPGILSYVSYNTSGTLSNNGTVMVTPTAGNVNVSYSTSGYILGQGALLKLNFNTIDDGTTSLIASNFSFNGVPVMIINQGLLTAGTSGGEVIDTLTVIQRPLLNIPAIVLPGETFNIECVAPSTVTNWSAQLERGNLSATLNITNTEYSTTPPRWILTAVVPNVNVFEQYDLRVSASGGINDRTRKSVRVLPSRKTNYYFAHLTDLHLPTHIFYPDPGYNTDSTEVVDFREVINDLNIIRPEFVLITGDLVNQGELEEFENLRVYSKAKRLLGELDIPIYLTAGNHDIGGWPATPPPAGSARKFWWKHFGWSWLNNTSASWPYNTQDYSFDYGPVHYTGLEAYVNYDSYLTNIYGGTSFTNRQMQWLQADLNAAGNSTKVLFHHYDFNNQLNLNTLGVNMALWGHIHYDSGSLTTQPYNLSTRAVCNGYRTYRIVRVNNTTLQPYASVNAGPTGNKITLDFYPGNYGYADSVRAVLVNNQPLAFEHSVIKFLMPAGNSEYTITNGVLEQVDRSGEFNVCYVGVNLPAYSTVTVTIKDNTTANLDETIPAANISFNAVYPNPFAAETNISINQVKAGNLSVNVYNLKGELVKAVYQGKVTAGTQYYKWDGKDALNRAVPAGIYLVRVSDGINSISRKVIYLK